MAKRATLRGQRCEGSKHNFREFDVTQSDHIDESRVHLDQYFDLTMYDGELLPMPEGACERDLIHRVYREQYTEGLNLQNAMYVKQGHRERCKTLEQLETGKQTRPIEFIFQLGDMHDHASGDELLEAFEQYLTKMQQYCQKNDIKCYLISAALHLDEKTPHIHYKCTFGANLQRGGQLPRQEECFRQAKLELPEPGKKESRYNNRLMTFTEQCRALEHEVFRNRGHEIETTPRPNMRHLETREYYVQSAINQQKSIQASVDRINAQLASERAEITAERSKLQSEYETQAADLNARERSISMRESLVKRVQENGSIELDGRQYDILDILKGLEHYEDAEVARFTEFFKNVAEQGRAELQEAGDSVEYENWEDWGDIL